MKLKKFLALCMSAAVTATAITTVMPAAAETSSQSNSITLFEETFETYPYVSDYTDDGKTLPINYGDGKKATAYNSDQFRYWADAQIDNNVVDNDNYKKMMTAGTLKNHIKFAEYSGFGNNKVMTVTSQGGANYSGILKKSNITSEKINNKELVFSIDFKVDRMLYGEGYGIYMSQANSKDELDPNQIENYWPALVVGKDAKEAEYKKQLLAIFPSSKVTLDSDGHNTTAIPVYAFGNKIGDVSANKNYTYTLELTPDGTGSYKASAYLNENGSAGSKVDITSNVPTAEEFAAYTHIMMSPMVHYWTLYDGQFGKPSAITNPPQYENDKKIISLDNLKMTAETIDNSILFKDDFEGYPYSKNTDGLPLWYGSKNNGTLAGTYDNDYFKYHTGYALDTRENVVNAYKDWMTNGSLAKHIQFIENAGVGTGKAMNITSQGFSNWGGILKQSNITSEKINNKELVFSIDFKVDRMYYGEGYGIYFSEYNSSKDEFSPYQKEDAYPDILFGANKTDANKQLLLIAPDKKNGTPQIFAFGVKVGEADSTKAHNYTLRLIPNANNSYRVYASLDGTNLGEVNSSDIPSVSDLANFKYIMMSPIAHKSTIKNNAGVTSYENDKSIISLDNLSMITTEPVNMDGANVNGYAKVSGEAGSKTVTVKVMPKSGASVKPYIIAAVYNADGSLKDVNFATTDSEITAAQELTVSGINADGESIKVFMWDGFTNTKPLTTSVEL